MSVKKVYDYLVLGAGSGGIASARRAASYGAKVAIVENGMFPSTKPAFFSRAHDFHPYRPLWRNVR